MLEFLQLLCLMMGIGLMIGVLYEYAVQKKEEREDKWREEN